MSPSVDKEYMMVQKLGTGSQATVFLYTYKEIPNQVVIYGDKNQGTSVVGTE